MRYSTDTARRLYTIPTVKGEILLLGQHAANREPVPAIVVIG